MMSFIKTARCLIVIFVCILSIPVFAQDGNEEIEAVENLRVVIRALGEYTGCVKDQSKTFAKSSDESAEVRSSQ